MREKIHADVIIVGAGTAGSVVAARLSEDASRNVLLLEAGPTALPQPDALLDATVIPGARGEFSWSFPGTLAHGRDWDHVRGRVIGGSSTTNGGYFIPAGPEDAEAWAAHGGDRWSWDRIRPIQRALETDLDCPSGSSHGHAGPVPVSRADADEPQIAAFRDAAFRAGLPADQDKGADWSDGFGVTPSNRRGNVRFNAALSHLAPAIDRPNLHLIGDASVLGVEITAGRARGVTALIGGVLTHLTSDEVVLAAGALRTPDLLRVSGIALPGLGDSLHDDPQVIIEVGGWPHSAPGGQTWLGGVVHATLTDGSTVEVLQSLQPLSQIAGHGADDSAPCPLFVSVSPPEPAGRLVRAYDDPAQLPGVEFDHLATDAARRRLREAVRFTTDLVRMGGGAVSNIDAPDLADDRLLDAWVRANLGTASHTTGGAALGTIVDGEGRVHGVEALRVADLSVLPTGLSRGPAATAFMIGELMSRP